jgi:hypothetical protein
MMTTTFIPISGTAWGLVLRVRAQDKIVTRTSHNSSHRTYQVDKSALHANILRRIPVCATLIIIRLKPNVVRWLNG